MNTGGRDFEPTRRDTPEGALPGLPALAEVQRAVEAKRAMLLVDRMRVALLLVLASLSFFLVQDLLFFRARATPLLLIKALQFVLAFSVLWLIRTDRLPRNTTAFAVCLSAVFALCATAAGMVRGSTSGTALLFIVVTAGTAIGFPWGVRAQAAFVALCAVLLAWNDYALPDAPLRMLAGPATGSMLTAGMVSIFVAYSVDRYRWEIEYREMGLRLREELFRSLIEHGGDLIVVVDVDGKTRYVSPSLRRLMGYAPGEWVGVPLLDFMHADDVTRWREALAASSSESGSVRTVEVRVRDTAQSWRVLDGAIANLLSNPAVRGVVFNARDVTERRRMESALHDSQAELTHVLRLGTISEIASALAHEINQPLSAISNYAGACVRRLEAGAGSSPDLTRGLQLIAAEALRAGRIVHGLRELSRKGGGGMEIIDLNEVVGRAVELMQPQARLQGIALRLQSSAAPPTVYADAIQIEQVVLNLLLNAIESMQSSAAKVIDVSICASDTAVEVGVRDTGVGLDPAVGDRAFEPFFTTKPTGLGMGLAISRRIIDAHGGEFRGAANPDGCGSAFAFLLPLVHESPARRDATAGARRA